MVLQSPTGSYRVLQGPTGAYRVLQGPTVMQMWGVWGILGLVELTLPVEHAPGEARYKMKLVTSRCMLLL